MPFASLHLQQPTSCSVHQIFKDSYKKKLNVVLYYLSMNCSRFSPFSNLPQLFFLPISKRDKIKVINRIYLVDVDFRENCHMGSSIYVINVFRNALFTSRIHHVASPGYH